MKGLYIHIPFCNSICSYCDFPKIVSKSNRHSIYIDRVIEEIKFYKNELKDITSVYIGGGTPNAISLSLLEKIFIEIEDVLATSNETTIELNPELITLELVSLLKKYRIHRVSLGVQSFKDTTLKFLNRHHTKQTVIDAVGLLRNNGIENINLDLMFGIPETSLADVQEDLKSFLDLKLPHVSYYSLILEDKTVLMHLHKQNKLELLEEDEIADMYDLICRTLKDMGYHHYEVSNFSKSGYESKHNMLYWKCMPYIGIGAGASGYINEYRYDNYREILKYQSEFVEFSEKIDTKIAKQEYFMLGLRMLDGVSISRYTSLFHSDPRDDFDFNRLIKHGLVEIIGDQIRIKENKIFVANQVFEEFVGE